MIGWIKLHRKIEDHWIFDNAEYFRAWTIMLMKVNHKKKGFIVNNVAITCNIGQCALSKKNWATAFGGSWTRQKVRTFFNKLELDGMIETEEITNLTTKLTICNYGIYQSSEPSEEPTYNQPITNPQPTLNQPVTTTKELKNEEKERIKEIVDYLNISTGKNYKDTSVDTIKKITARFNDGYTIDDFKKVVDVKVKNWTGGEHERYLQPSTLFGNKFDNYLNEPLVVKIDKEQEGIAKMLGYEDSNKMPFKVITP